MRKIWNRFLKYNIYLTNTILALVLCACYLANHRVLFGIAWLLLSAMYFIDYSHKKKVYKRRMQMKK